MEQFNGSPNQRKEAKKTGDTNKKRDTNKEEVKGKGDNEYSKLESVRRNMGKREVSPLSSVGSYGFRLKKKRKPNGGMNFESEEAMEFNQGKTTGEDSGVKKDRWEEHKQSYRSGEKNKGRVPWEAVSSKCIVKMEQVKEIGELIGVLWILAEDE
ncbi:hypothetical protein Tco_0117989 [Tanacetum coccineum]